MALVGPSGGGKSTIFALIERFYDPDSGSVRIGPKRLDLKSVNLNWWHSRVALVSQEPVLFGGSIKENISFSLEGSDIDMERIIEAAKLANAHDFIMTFENGYDTIVGERGIRLSGGQKQSRQQSIKIPTLLFLCYVLVRNRNRTRPHRKPKTFTLGRSNVGT